MKFLIVVSALVCFSQLAVAEEKSIGDVITCVTTSLKGAGDALKDLNENLKTCPHDALEAPSVKNLNEKIAEFTQSVDAFWKANLLDKFDAFPKVVKAWGEVLNAIDVIRNDKDVMAGAEETVACIKEKIEEVITVPLQAIKECGNLLN